ncbi:MAG: flagellar basal body rod protein [Myxococcota bacterium]|jgi:flagellar hook protein FlgE|nr:flagellar basal body rod protein [Myxococcota bacterium]
MDDALTIARSGLHIAQVRMRNSAHNVANLVTDDFHNHRTVQTSRAGGGSSATTRIDTSPRPVSLAHEVVEQIRAKTQFKASARVIATNLDMKGTLLDTLA